MLKLICSPTVHYRRSQSKRIQECLLRKQTINLLSQQSDITDHRRPQFCLPFQNTSLKPKHICLNTKWVDIYLTPRASPNRWGQIFVEPLGVYASVRTHRGWKISDVNGSCLARTHAQQRRGPTAEHMTEVKQNYPTGPARTIANERSLRRAADAANAAAVLMLWALLAMVLFLVLFLLLLLPPLLLL